MDYAILQMKGNMKIHLSSIWKSDSVIEAYTWSVNTTCTHSMKYSIFALPPGSYTFVLNSVLVCTHHESESSLIQEEPLCVHCSVCILSVFFHLFLADPLTQFHFEQSSSTDFIFHYPQPPDTHTHCSWSNNTVWTPVCQNRFLL